MSKKRKCAIAALAVFTVILTALWVFLAVWSFGAKYPAFDKNVRAEAQIEGLGEGFVPQGLCELPAGGYAVSGYMKDKSASRVYFLGGEAAKYVTVEEDGAALKTHFGGVSATESYLYLTSGKKIVRVSLAAALSSENGGAVSVSDAFEVDFGIAFCQIYDGLLFVGEFYRPGNYETDASHHVTVDGETNPALVYCYPLDETKAGGVGDSAPIAALSVRGLVQGIALTEEHIYLSCSWGLADSEICVYQNPLGGTEDAMLGDVPMYFLGEKKLISSEKLPSMTEGIYAKEGRLYILFESACQKYKYFVRRRIDHVVSVPLEMFD